MSDIGALIALLGVGLLGFKGLLLMLPESKTVSAPTALPENKPTTMLPSAQSGEPVSGTERTTRPLEPVHRGRKSQ